MSKKEYVCPEIDVIRVQTQEILTASDEEVFVDGGGLFN